MVYYRAFQQIHQECKYYIVLRNTKNYILILILQMYMNHIVIGTDSRGRGLREIISRKNYFPQCHIHFGVFPGGKFSKVVSNVLDEVDRISRQQISTSTLYTTLPHNLIKEKLINLIEWTFKREGSPYIACNERQAFFTSEDTKRYELWSCQNVCEALIYLLDNIYIRFGTKLYRQIVGIPMGTNCAPLVADLFLFCYERDFMTSLSDVKQAEIIEAFKSTSRYLDDLLNIDNPYFEGMVNRIYPPELQLNKASTSDTEAPFLDLHLSISNGFVSSKIYDKRDDFDFDIVNFRFLDGDVPRSTSYGVYISQLIRFARVSSHVVDFNARNKSLTAKLLQQGYRYHKLRKTFSKFYRRHYELVSKFNVGLKTLLHQGLSEPEFYGDLVLDIT